MGLDKSYWNEKFLGNAFPWGEKESGPAVVAAKLFSDEKCAKVLDAGCGSGRDSFFLAEKGFKVTGIDFSPEAIRTANSFAVQKNSSATFIEASLSDLMITDEFDCALCCDVLHLFGSGWASAVVRNIAESLKKNGLFVLTVFSESEKNENMDRPLHLFSEKRLLILLEPLFTIEKIERMDFEEEHDGNRHSREEWLVVARKK